MYLVSTSKQMVTSLGQVLLQEYWAPWTRRELHVHVHQAETPNLPFLLQLQLQAAVWAGQTEFFLNCGYWRTGRGHGNYAAIPSPDSLRYNFLQANKTPKLQERARKIRVDLCSSQWCSLFFQMRFDCKNKQNWPKICTNYPKCQKYSLGSLRNISVFAYDECALQDVL